MSGETTMVVVSRLERLAKAIESTKLDDGREGLLKSLLAGAVDISRASRGYAILMEGDTVVAEASRTQAGDAYRADEETRKLAARSSLRVTGPGASRRFAIEAHGAKAGIAAQIDGKLGVSIILDRPDAEADPGVSATAGYLITAAALQRASLLAAAARPAMRPTETAVAAGGVGAVAYLKTVDELERDAIELALRQTNWKKDEAAKRLGISRASIYMKVKKFNLQHPPA